MGSLLGFFRLIGFLWSNSDQIFRLLKALIRQLPTVGQGFEIAGQGAKHASYVVKGGGGVPINARRTVDLAAQAIDACYQQVQNASGAIRDVRDMIKGVTVPSLAATTTGITVPVIDVGISVPTFNVTDTTPFGTAAYYLDIEAQQFDGAAAQLQSAAAQLRDLSNALNTAGDDLYSLGLKLEDGGRILKQIGS